MIGTSELLSSACLSVWTSDDIACRYKFRRITFRHSGNSVTERLSPCSVKCRVCKLQCSMQALCLNHKMTLPIFAISVSKFDFFINNISSVVVVVVVLPKECLTYTFVVFITVRSPSLSHVRYY